MWIKAMDGSLYNADLAFRIAQSPGHENIVVIDAPGAVGSKLSVCGSVEEAQRLVERIGLALLRKEPFFEVVQESFEVVVV